jgi:mycothiol synthase
VNDSRPIAVRAQPPAVLEHPPVHLELTWRPLTREDAPALFELIEAVEAADEAPYRMSLAEAIEMFDGDWKDWPRDSLGGFDETGTMRAYARVEVRPGDATTIRAFLSGSVHPAWRGRGIGRALVRWAEGRGRQKLAESGKELPGRLAVFVNESHRDGRRLYAAAGFSPIRWYTSMRRDLSLPLPDARIPDRVRIAAWNPDLDEAIRLAHNEAFADHWGSEPQTVESWAGHEAHFVPEWSFVAIDDAPGSPDLVGYALSSRFEQDWEVQGYRSGYTDLLGVRRPWRGKGIAVALLAETMAAYLRDGMEYATLGVDTANPTGAHGLYARLGYEPTHGDVLYTVEL